MKVGVIARAEDRGLGIQTWEAVRHLHPDRVLVVDVSNPDGFPMHLDRYPEATVARLQAGRWLAESLVREWLDGLDVVFSVETLYDWRLADWARDAGVATVVQMNPEFFQHDLPGWVEQEPTVWWNPTTWRALAHRAEVRHVPVPVALDRFGSLESREPIRESRQLVDEPRRLRALHIIGRAALGDRNGTEIVHSAKAATTHVDWTLRAQRAQDRAPGADGAVPNYWDLYRDQDVLVMPRRYGGLCLPTQEAMAAGMAVVMPACPPNTDWPIVPAVWQFQGTIVVPCGEIPMVATDAPSLAGILDRMAVDPQLLDDYRLRSRDWATRHSWQALLPMYESELGYAVDRNLTALAP